MLLKNTPDFENLTFCTTSPFVVASIQLGSQTDIDANLNTIRTAVTDAARHGAKLVILPENACVMGRQHELAGRFDEMVSFFGQLAQSLKIHLVAGTLPCPKRSNGKPTTDGKYRQSCLVFDPSGKQIARYDKIHLFRATVNDSTGNYDEGKTFEAGDRLVIVPIRHQQDIINLGLMICFDVRFGFMAHQLAKLGADIISVPAAFTYQTGQAHWQTLLQARALDSQCMVVGSTQGGDHHIGDSIRQTWGHAMIVNANGQVVSNTNHTDAGVMGYRICYATFDKKNQNLLRQRLPIFECQRLI